MSRCRYCGKEVTPRFGHLARHEAGCTANPQPHTDPLKAKPAQEDEQPRFRPRMVVAGGPTIWARK